MTLSEQITADMEVFFNTSELARTVTLNGSQVSAVVHDIEQKDDGPSVLDRLTVEFQAADYPAIANRTDKLVVDGETWAYPQIVSYDAHTKIVQFRRNEKVRPR